MNTTSHPRVTVGLPVFNGERHLAAAIESILAQTFTDLELIISDNASTDRTAEICQGYAKRDPRVRCFRNEQNAGALPNFNRTFELARGDYFKWAAHDDILAPQYLEKCVAVLDDHPDVVVCHSEVLQIDDEGQPSPSYHVPVARAGDVGADHRFAGAILTDHTCTEIFGLIRANVLRSMPLLRGWVASDRVVVAELTLRGRIVYLPEPLFHHRNHDRRYVHTAKQRTARARWHDASLAGRIVPDSWYFYGSYFGAVRRSAATWPERIRCYGHLLRWPFVNMNFVLLLIDRSYYTLDPRLRHGVGRAKRWLTLRGAGSPQSG